MNMNYQVVTDGMINYYLKTNDADLAYKFLVIMDRLGIVGTPYIENNPKYSIAFQTSIDKLKIIESLLQLNHKAIQCVIRERKYNGKSTIEHEIEVNDEPLIDILFALGKQFGLKNIVIQLIITHT